MQYMVTLILNIDQYAEKEACLKFRESLKAVRVFKHKYQQKLLTNFAFGKSTFPNFTNITNITNTTIIDHIDHRENIYLLFIAFLNQCLVVIRRNHQRKRHQKLIPSAIVYVYDQKKEN